MTRSLIFIYKFLLRIILHFSKSNEKKQMHTFPFPLPEAVLLLLLPLPAVFIGAVERGGGSSNIGERVWVVPLLPLASVVVRRSCIE